ncbi:hypothetical protein C5C56_11715 [Rathayibacter sp. AY1D1]|uniref:hypothetical protein n=1 Tax=Rathayibacter sp. AY1D1 TaxID=2080542 RepID=UPI000CE83D99|nr:hypothetical protein [Rathayibacter sp. AY1D1]PPH97814.1 hypothetical protein C5C56_11715 [Rathayibacter sp. AY1D1]
MIAAFLDLDRTLIHSATAAEGVIDALAVVERIDGRASAYAPPTLARDLIDLASLAAVVPTTTRSVAQLARVTLFDSVPTRFRIAANGGVLLEDGSPVEAWSRRVLDAVAAGGTSVSLVRERTAALVPTATVRIVDGVFVYAVLAAADQAEAARGRLLAFAEDIEWRCSRQGRKVYLVPHAVEKSTAMSEVARRLGADLILAAGDAELDRLMLGAADHAVVPAHADVLRPPGVVATLSSGPHASTEIVRRLRDLAERHRRRASAFDQDKETRWISASG